MTKQGILNLILLLALISFAGISIYKVEQNNKDIAQSKIEIDTLKKTVDKQAKELKTKDDTIRDLKKEVTAAQEAVKQQNTQVDNTQDNTVTYNPF
ncbi:hypothetical protein JNUCC83_09785 [Vagococcus sp. JNUCC 83]